MKNMLVLLIIVITAFIVWFGVHAAYEHMGRGLIANQERLQARIKNP